MSDSALRMFERARAQGDLAAHAAIKEYRRRCGMPAEIPLGLVAYDWDEAFGPAGDRLSTTKQDGQPFVLDYDYNKYNNADLRPSREVAVSLAPFDRRDIKRLIGSSPGDNDGPKWIALMELWDGRFAFLSAGCDYTGWD